MSRFPVLCALCAILVTAGGWTFNSCTHIEPQSPILELGTNLTASCILDPICLKKLNNSITSITAQELFWKVGHMVIPKNQYTVINDTVSSVTFQPTLSMHNSVTCSIMLYGQTEVTLHGIYYTLGYPPEKPQNLTCICYNAQTLTCTWEAGRPTIMPTKYTLKQYWLRPELVNNTENLTPSDHPHILRPHAPRRYSEREKCEAEAGNNFCTLESSKFMLYIGTWFKVEAVNDLGKAESDQVYFADLIDVLKPDPPTVMNVFPVLQRVLRIEWENPLKGPGLDLRYNLRYRTLDSTEWSEVPAEDLEKTLSSFALQELHPYRTYVVSVRCKVKDKGYWSEWSKEHRGTTAESTPSRGPDFWRKIIRRESNEKRVVRLMWKDLESDANGIILGYNVTVKRGGDVIDSRVVKDLTSTITVPKESCEVVLTAYNSQGSSPPSTLVIPSAATDQAVVQPPTDMNLKVYPEDGRLWVEWTPSGRALGYVIEWCNNSESMDCEPGWQREPSDATKTFLRGNLEPHVYYLIRLIPQRTDGKERSSMVGAYLQEGVPEVGPVVTTKATGKTWVTLVWQPVPLSQRNGFITNYTVKYGESYGVEKAFTVNTSVTECMLKSLAARTTYGVTVTANTEKGSKAGVSYSFTTAPFDKGDVEAIVVSSCLGFLVFVLVACFFFCNKREQIKKHFWPNVPDPSKSNIAQWSPQTPSRHESKRHPFQDGPFTDVSVVEITADEKKSYGDPDTKSVDLVKKNTSEGLSSGIGGSSCLSSPQLSVSESDGISCAQNTSGTVQYSTVIMGGYQGQTPMFSRSESTQPLLISEERPDEQPPVSSEDDTDAPTPSQYFKQNFTAEDGSRSQEPSPAQVLHLAGFSQGCENQDFTTGQNPDPQSQGEEPKTYLPQTVKQGGYLPQ